jgi:competence protein ComGC
MNYENYSKYVYIFMILFITGIAFYHLIDMTKFVYNYNTAFDYGKTLQNICKKEYFEYETNRFQIASAIDDIKFKYDEKGFIIFIATITIIMGMLFTYEFTKILYRLLIKHNAFGIDINFSFIKFFTALIRKLIENNYHWSYWVAIFYVIIAFITIIFIFVMLPLYFSLYFSIKEDISPFNTTNSYYGLYLTFFIIIIIARLAFMIDIIPYFNEGNFTVASFLNFFVLFGFYIFIYHILGNFIKLHNELIDNPDQFRYDNMSDINSFASFYAGLLGYRDIDNYKRLSGTSFLIFIILIVLGVIYIAFQFITKLKASKEDFGLLQMMMMICIILIIIIFVISNFISYNSVVNTYIIDKPSESYNQHISEINQTFNIALDTEYDEIEGHKQEYMCRNYGNAIINVLYSHLFKNIELKSINDTTSFQLKLLDITPEFVYDVDCDNVMSFAFNDYKSYPEYDVSYYLNAKQFKKSIFYYFDKCSNANLQIIIQLFTNIYGILDNISLQVRDKLHSDDKFDINNPNYKEIKDNLDILKSNITNDILKAITNVGRGNPYYNDKEKISLIKNPKKEDIEKDDKLKKISTTELLESYNINNKIKDITKISVDFSEMLYYRDYIYDRIAKVYIDMIIDFLKYYGKICVKVYNDNQQLTNIALSKNPDTYKPHITAISNIIIRTFNKINENLSQPIYRLKNGKLTSYIIMNYNSINETPYAKNMFYQEIISHQDNEPEYKEKDKLKLLYSYFNTLQKDYDKILELYSLLKENNIPEYNNKYPFVKNIFDNYNTNSKPDITLCGETNIIIPYITTICSSSNCDSSSYISSNCTNIGYIVTNTSNLMINMNDNRNIMTSEKSQAIDVDITKINNLFEDFESILETRMVMYKKPSDSITKEPSNYKVAALTITADATKANHLIYIVMLNYMFAVLMTKIIVI